MTKEELQHIQYLAYQIEELDAVIKQDGMLLIGRANHSKQVSLHNEDADIVVEILKANRDTLQTKLDKVPATTDALNDMPKAIYDNIYNEAPHLLLHPSDYEIICNVCELRSSRRHAVDEYLNIKSLGNTDEYAMKQTVKFIENFEKLT